MYGNVNLRLSELQVGTSVTHTPGEAFGSH